MTPATDIEAAPAARKTLKKRVIPPMDLSEPLIENMPAGAVDRLKRPLHSRHVTIATFGEL